MYTAHNRPFNQEETQQPVWYGQMSAGKYQSYKKKAKELFVQVVHAVFSVFNTKRPTETEI